MIADPGAASRLATGHAGPAQDWLISAARICIEVAARQDRGAKSRSWQSEATIVDG
jgi:hypothetical protein